MKYGQHLYNNIAPEYGQEPYLKYRDLDNIIRVLNQKTPIVVDPSNRKVSLSAPPPSDASGEVLQDESSTEEDFYNLLDAEMAKVETFTQTQVKILRDQIAEAETLANVAVASTNDDTKEKINVVKEKSDVVAEGFLRLEKYVNINFMGFHKILKKHDKYLPSNPCKTFYLNRLHNQAWVRGDYSDLVVRLSHIYSTLRNDKVVEDTSGESQSFLRSTTKYWVKTEDVSRVKYEVLRHLPVFLQKTSTGESDSQLTNSVYLDNDQLELYHNRLDKTPGAIALRLRWYGTGSPSTVFVERKTHQDTWTGEVSVKERFMCDETDIQRIMTDSYDIDKIKENMVEKGTSQTEVQDWEALVKEVVQVIGSKQLIPTMRTQYMRTAFQIPFDPSVRISLDTNLCMISERGYDLKGGSQWRRDSSMPHLKNTEVTRFPHAILEIKLELSKDTAEPPRWVQELQTSGMLFEVHKFSKFIHGCATLLSDDVRSVPYWVDDASIRDSIIASDAGCILNDEDNSYKNSGVGPGANQVYKHLLPFGNISENRASTAIGRTGLSAVESIKANDDKTEKRHVINKFSLRNDNTDEEDDDDDDDDYEYGCIPRNKGPWPSLFCCPSFNTNYSEPVLAPASIQKIEPKVFFANERTFLHWLHNGVTLSTIAAGILAFSEVNDKGEMETIQIYAMILLLVSLGFIVYALNVFTWRAERIKTRVPGRWDDPRGPIFLGGVLAAVLIVNLCLKLKVILKLRHYSVTEPFE